MAVNNKLHAIQPSLGRWPGTRRNTCREEVVLARIRLGHTYLTHSYLLNREDQPECVGCACPLTVQHIMSDCVEFADIRNLLFRCQKHERSLRFSYTFNNPTVLFSRCDLTSYLGLCTHLTLFFSSGLCLDSWGSLHLFLHCMTLLVLMYR